MDFLPDSLASLVNKAKSTLKLACPCNGTKACTTTKEEPCQELFDAYTACVKKSNGTVDMVFCEDIQMDFQKCMRAVRVEKSKAETEKNESEKLNDVYAEIGKDYKVEKV